MRSELESKDKKIRILEIKIEEVEKQNKNLKSFIQKSSEEGNSNINSPNIGDNLF